MSSIATIRHYTEDDAARVKAAAVRFCTRHKIAFCGDDDAEPSIEMAIYNAWPGDKARLRSQWAAVYCRALGVACSVRVTVGWGQIGLTTP
jgi:hypothetical protein